MFVNHLNPLQQGCLLGLSKLVIEVDGSLSSKETEVFSIIKSQCQDTVSVAEEPMSLIEDCFKDNTSKVSLMLELVGVAYADSEYHENEKALLNNIANKLGLSQDLLQDIETWVERQLALVKEAQVMLEV